MADRDPQIAGRNYPAYDADYAAWLHAQVELLGSARFAELDMPNLIDEVESLGRSDFHRFESAIRIVLLHLMKWDVQTDHRTRSWATSIDGHRTRVLRELRNSPSYKARIGEAVEEAYRQARLEAHQETRLPIRSFAEECPYAWEDIIERPIAFDQDATMRDGG